MKLGSPFETVVPVNPTGTNYPAAHLQRFWDNHPVAPELAPQISWGYKKRYGIGLDPQLTTPNLMLAVSLGDPNHPLLLRAGDWVDLPDGFSDIRVWNPRRVPGMSVSGIESLYRALFISGDASANFNTSSQTFVPLWFGQMGLVVAKEKDVRPRWLEARPGFTPASLLAVVGLSNETATDFHNAAAGTASWSPPFLVDGLRHIRVVLRTYQHGTGFIVPPLSGAVAPLSATVRPWVLDPVLGSATTPAGHFVQGSPFNARGMVDIVRQQWCPHSSEDVPVSYTNMVADWDVPVGASLMALHTYDLVGTNVTRLFASVYGY